MTRQPWTREETLVAFNLYCRTPFGRLHARNPEIVQVAEFLGRTSDAVAMKCCNLAAFDSALQSRGIVGLRKGSRLDEEIWQEFKLDPEVTAFAAEEAYARLMRQDLRAADVIEWEDVEGLDRTVITKVRVNQSFFRSIILTGYRNRCAVCELPFTSLLVASHIVPWSVDRSLRMNPHNGVCLCAIHDRAYDKGLISISMDFRIELHPKVELYGNVRSVVDHFIQYTGKLIALPDRWHPDPDLLRRHSAILAASEV